MSVKSRGCLSDTADESEIRALEASVALILKRSETLIQASRQPRTPTSLHSTASTRRHRAFTLLSLTSQTDVLPLDRSSSFTSHRSIPAQEQFHDGQATPSLNGQPPAVVRTFRRSVSSASQYEAAHTPNMAYIDREVTRARSKTTLNDSISEVVPQTFDDVTDQATSNTRPLRSDSRGRSSKRSTMTVCNASERAQERSIAEMLSGGPRHRARTYHGRHPAMDFRKPPPIPAMRDSPACEIPEVVQREKQGSLRHSPRSARIEQGNVFNGTMPNGEMFLGGVRLPLPVSRFSSTPNNGSPVRPLSPSHLYVVNPDRPSSSLDTDSDWQVPDPRTTRVFAGPNDYFGDSISVEVDLAEDIEAQDQPQLTSPSPIPASPPQIASPTSPLPLYAQDDLAIHPAYRRHTVAPPNAIYPRPLERLPSLLTSEALDSAGTQLSTLPSSQNRSHSQLLPRPSTHATRHPNRWYIALYNYIRHQPSEYPPNQTGAEFVANLEHNIAPTHWLFRWLQIVVWLVTIVLCCLRIVNVKAQTGGRLPFNCHKLVTKLGIQRPEPLYVGLDSSAIIDGHEDNDETLKGLFDSDTVCELVPLNGALFLAHDFVTLMLLGVTACGLALLVQALWLKIWRRAFEWSGAYGLVTLVMGVVGQVGSWFLGVAVVVGVAWGVTRSG